LTGSRGYSHDIPEGGIEIPCDYIFSGSALLTEKTIGRLKELQEKVPAIRNILDCTTIILFPTPKICVIADDACAVPVVSSTESNLSAPLVDSVWVKIEDITLKNSNKAIVEQDLELTDLHIKCAQRLLQGQFPKQNSLKLSLLQSKALKGSTNDAIQSQQKPLDCCK